MTLLSSGQCPHGMDRYVQPYPRCLRGMEILTQYRYHTVIWNSRKMLFGGLVRKNANIRVYSSKMSSYNSAGGVGGGAGGRGARGGGRGSGRGRNGGNYQYSTVMGGYSRANGPAGPSNSTNMVIRGGVVGGAGGSVSGQSGSANLSVEQQLAARAAKEQSEKGARKSDAGGSNVDPDTEMGEKDVEEVEDPRLVEMRASLPGVADEDLKSILRGRDEKEKKEKAEADAIRKKAEADALAERLAAAPKGPQGKKRQAEPSEIEVAEAALQKQKEDNEADSARDKAEKDVLRAESDEIHYRIHVRTLAIVEEKGVSEVEAKKLAVEESDSEIAAARKKGKELAARHNVFAQHYQKKLDDAEHALVRARASADLVVKKAKEKEENDEAKKLRYREFQYFKHLRSWNEGTNVHDNMARTRDVERRHVQGVIASRGQEVFMEVARQCFSVRMGPEAAQRHARDAWAANAPNFDLTSILNLYSVEELAGRPVMPCDVREARVLRGFDGDGEDPAIMAEFGFPGLVV